MAEVKYQTGDPTQRAPFFDFGGGLNTTDPPHLIKDNQLTRADDVIIEGSTLKKRLGTQQIGATLSAKVSGLYGYKQYDGDIKLMASASTGVYYDSAGTWTIIYGTTTAAHNVEMQTYLDKVFVANGIDLLQSWDGDAVVSGTSVAPDHTAENFTAVAHGLLDDDRIRFAGTLVPTGLSFSTTYYVINKAADTFQVALTSGGAAVTFTANGTAVTVTEYMHEYSGLPVASAAATDQPHYLESFKERLIMANTDSYPYRVYYTAAGASTISTTDYFDVDSPITGLKVYKNYLYIFTSDEMYRVDGFVFNGAGSEAQRVNRLSLGVGTISHRSIEVVNNIMYFLDSNDIYAFDGSAAYPIASPIIQETFDNLSKPELANACSGRQGDKYILTVPNEVITTTTGTVWATFVWGVDSWGYNEDTEFKSYDTLVFDTNAKSWVKYQNYNANVYANVEDDNQDEQLYYGDGAFVWLTNTGYATVEKNLVVNHSFETGTAGNTPTSWTETVDAGTASATKETSNRSLGSFALTVSKSTGCSSVLAYQNITATAASKYQLSGFIKTSHIGDADEIEIQVINASTAADYGTISVGDKDNRGGRYWYREVTVPTAVTAIRIQCVDTSSGDSIAYFDDVRLCKYEDVVGTNDGLISMDVRTKAFTFNAPSRKKIIKELFILAKSSSQYNLDETTYPLTYGYADGLYNDFTTGTITMDEEEDHVEKYIKTRSKSKFQRYQFTNTEPLNPIDIFGIEIEFIPVKSFR